MPKLLALLLFGGYLVFLSVMSLFSFGKISTLGSAYDDKVNHALAHLLLVLLAYNFYRFTRLDKLIFISLLTSIGYGIVIEVLQLTITTDRTFDLMDLVANFTGALIAVFLLKFKGFVKLN